MTINTDKLLSDAIAFQSEPDHDELNDVLLKNKQVQLLVIKIKELERSSKPIVIAVAGRSGSGKSSMVAALRQSHFRTSTLISLDDFARGNPWVLEQQLLGTAMNWDHPEYFEITHCAQLIEMLKQGTDVEIPQFDFISGTRLSSKIKIQPNNIIFLEGLHTLSPILQPLIDIAVFIEVSFTKALERRIARDQVRTHMTAAEISTYVEKQAEPVFLQHIEPQKKIADFIIKN